MECSTLWRNKIGKMYIDLDYDILLSDSFYRALLNLHPTFIQYYWFSETIVLRYQHCHEYFCLKIKT